MKIFSGEAREVQSWWAAAHRNFLRELEKSRSQADRLKKKRPAS